MLVLAGLFLLGWIVVAWRGHAAGRRPAHPVLRRAGLASAFVLMLLTGGLLAVNSYAGYVPSLGALRDLLTGRTIAPTEPSSAKAAVLPAVATRLTAAGPPAAPGSRLVALRVSGPGLGIAPQTTYVYLPAGYDLPANATRRYPVVYLIHGYPGGSADWLRAGRANEAMDLVSAQHLVGRMILVMPDANGGWLHDSECLNAVAGPLVETYLTSTVVAVIDGHFRTLATRSGRAIGGMSSGGYCALNLSLRHQDTFAVILASEPYGDPGRNVVGPELGGSVRLFRANSPSSYVPTTRFTHPMAVFLDAGSNDPGTARTAVTLARALAERGQYVALRLAGGLHHTWREARVELPYSLVFAAAHFRPAAPAVTTS